MTKKIRLLSTSIMGLVVIAGFSTSLGEIPMLKNTENNISDTSILENRCVFSGNCSSCVVNSPLIKISIPDSGIARIKFNTQYKILPIDGPDYGYVKLSDDGGNTWRIMCALQGVQNEWTEIEFDMFQWVGEITILFEYYTFSAFTLSRGWYIDSIMAEGLVGEHYETIYSENFEEYGIDDKWGSWFVSKMPGEDDDVPPDTMITNGPTGTINENSALFEWTGTDAAPGTPTWDLIYSYLLEGYNTEWSSWTLSTSMVYSNLPNGEYTFRVKAKDLENNIDPTPANRSFVVSAKKDRVPPVVDITRPREGFLYVADTLETTPLPTTIIIGKITVITDAYDMMSPISKVEFYVDDVLKNTDNTAPYKWEWDETVFWRHTLKTIAYDEAGNIASDEIVVYNLNLG